MTRTRWMPLLCLVCLVAASAESRAQKKPYIGFAYPAGGQQGTSFEVRLGGQELTDVCGVFVSGEGVTAKVQRYDRRLNNQDIDVLNGQLKELKASLPKPAAQKPAVQKPAGRNGEAPKPVVKEADPATLKLIAVIEKRLAEHVGQPAVQSVANLVYIEVTIAANAPPGDRELRLITTQGVSNPLVFQVGQLREFCRKAMITSSLQVLGKEELGKRQRPVSEAENRVTLPCTVNGQVASGEVNFYRFSARKDQRLVFSTSARRLIPYIADAVPGWFQPVLRLCDSAGNEVAYVDDFRFSPDPTILYQVPADGEFVLSIYDGIFRGREDFVYRISMGETPFVSHIFPLGGRAGGPPQIVAKGWNLGQARVAPPPAGAPPGQHLLAVTNGKLVSNRVPYDVDPLPELFAKESGSVGLDLHKVTLPVIVNGRIDQAEDRDIFEFSGQAGETVVAEVVARRLGSPMDSSLTLTDAKGNLLDFSDDSEDQGSGLNTHHADSYLMVKLPANGIYRIGIGESTGCGGEEFGYRLRISAPQPDFELRVVPSSLAIKGKSANKVTVYAIRRDGFLEPITLGLKDPPRGFSAPEVVLAPYQDSVSFTVKTDLTDTGLQTVNLSIEGRATVFGQELAHVAVPAEDRMQAFLWRHLVPAGEFKVLVFDPAYKPPVRRVPPKVEPIP